MRMFFFMALLAIGSGFWFKWFVQSGEMDAYLDSHPNPKVNSQAEYYWGITLELAGHQESARTRFRRIYEKYPGTDYAPLAWAELINIAYETDDTDTVVAEGKAFLEKYPDHPKAEVIRRKVLNSTNGN